MESIRVERIQVVKLFDEITYDIRLDENKPVGIIIAPNGRGKTTILKMLSFVFEPTYERFQEIKDVPFTRFVCYLSNGKRITLKTIPTGRFEFESREQRNMYMHGMIKPGSEAGIMKTVNDFEYRILPAEKKENKGIIFSNLLESQNDYLWPDYVPESDVLPTRDLRGRITGLTPISTAARFEDALRKYIVDNKCDKSIVFIGTSRLQMEESTRNRLSRSESREREMVDPLVKAAANIASIIRLARDQYSMEVSKAKDRLPRLFLQSDPELPTLDVFLRRWRAYTDELEKFQRIGLIEHNKEFINENEIPNVYETKKEFLNTYLEAFRYTTKPLNDVYKKLNLFKTIFDERNSITHKTVKCGPKGIELFSRKKKLDPSLLSSGEKHDFIMFYNLIFNASKGSLILVDEPEISLHIEWQESYLDNLIEICKTNQMQAIVATHSPNIVSTHYDCLLDMGEQNANS